MSSLDDPLPGTRLPPICTGRLTAAERDAADAAISDSIAAVKAGTARVQFWEGVLSTVISQAAGLTDQVLAMRAAKAMRKAAEAELAKAQLEAEGEHE